MLLSVLSTNIPFFPGHDGGHEETDARVVWNITLCMIVQFHHWFTAESTETADIRSYVLKQECVMILLYIIIYAPGWMYNIIISCLKSCLQACDAYDRLTFTFRGGCCKLPCLLVLNSFSIGSIKPGDCLSELLLTRISSARVGILCPG